MALSGGRVRARFVGWSASHATTREQTPWTAAVLVAMAVAEAGRALLGATDVAAWDQPVTVPSATRDLERRSALSALVVRRALDVLVSAEVLDCHSRIGDELVVQLRADLFEHAPVLAAVAWEHVRDRLGTTVTPAALLVLADLAARATLDDRWQGRFLPASLRDLEEATGNGKGAVRTALSALAHAGLIESRLRPRLDSWHRLLPPVFGDEGGADSGAPRRFSVDRGVTEAGQFRGPSALPVEAGRVGPAPTRALPAIGGEPGGTHALQSRDRAPDLNSAAGHGGAASQAAASVGWAIVEVNGVRLPVPAGVTPQPEQDPVTGEWFLRVGPNTRSGPLRFF